MAFTTLVIGHLNILTITFAPILVGIAIDFGVHLIARYEEELRRGLLAEEAMRKAMVFTGLGIVTDVDDRRRVSPWRPLTFVGFRKWALSVAVAC